MKDKLVSDIVGSNYDSGIIFVGGQDRTIINLLNEKAERIEKQYTLAVFLVAAILVIFLPFFMSGFYILFSLIVFFSVLFSLVKKALGYREEIINEKNSILRPIIHSLCCKRVYDIPEKVSAITKLHVDFVLNPKADFFNSGGFRAFFSIKNNDYVAEKDTESFDVVFYRRVKGKLIFLSESDAGFVENEFDRVISYLEEESLVVS
jgi:hypothetical protein